MVSESKEYLALFPPADKPSQQSYTFEELDEEQRAVLVPAQIFDHKKDDPAFIFSADNLQTIKRYERAVRQLPLRQEVDANLAFGVLGIQTADVNVLFDNLRTHVNSWDAIEDACKKLGSDLQVFAETLTLEGAELVSELKSMPSWDSQVVSKELADSTLTTEEAKTFREKVDSQLAVIREDINGKRRGTQQVRELVDRFGDDISENLKPMANALSLQVQAQSIPEKLLSLQRAVAELDKKIQQKLDQYNKLVGYSFTGLAFGPIGLLITGGVYGSQAETVRSEKNALIEQRARLDLDIKDLTGDVGGFEAIGEHIADIQFRLVDVGVAAKNLEDIWILLEAYVDHSLRRANNVSTQQEVLRFVVSFERVISPWEKIKDISKHLSRLFNETVKI
ncbi:alpha-xenorhabdolysin family binary toxin subunit A [Pseudomonas sp. S31]|uniref:alpha-xenorhabdolysin family binary toxin subunit A n=1 Tax=Pseudomonas sp. S31 TaxID=1564473 RepID=UPI0019145390|nr:alpha-xenorhabdolysin family binary toxin subunit A [Pseudomonas sp. S31]MBK5000111.1 alpha-xenorhabdolysin family binary toxin subunit A [Pseudomonas sp. S31]